MIGQKHTYKAFSKGRKPGLFVNFDQLPCSWIRIRIPNMHPDPDPGARSIPNTVCIRIRIQNSQTMLSHANPDSQHCKLGSVYVCYYSLQYTVNTWRILPSTLHIFGQGLEAICVMRIIQRAKGHTIKNLNT